jgi:hypothetical protein
MLSRVSFSWTAWEKGVGDGPAVGSGSMVGVTRGLAAVAVEALKGMSVAVTEGSGASTQPDRHARDMTARIAVDTQVLTLRDYTKVGWRSCSKEDILETA